jgi:dTDP-4-dehydrorhamnose reductase
MPALVFTEMSDFPILITGASGQLGHALAKQAAQRGLDHRAVARPDFDFNDPATLDACFHAASPAMVINAAAWTAVDAAEAHEAAAYRANHDGPARLAALCRDAGVPLIHVSTDYVFDGSKGSPYRESDETAPLGVYGASKRAGEIAVLESGAQAIILRTAWVFAATGKNFPRTMINAARKTGALRVVADQQGTPTAAEDLAGAILTIAERIRASGWREDYQGVFHATNQGATTWYGFAQAIFESAAAHGEVAPVITPISTADWPTPVRRPADSRLDCLRLKRVFGIALPPWQDAARRIIAALLTEVHA